MACHRAANGSGTRHPRWLPTPGASGEPASPSARGSASRQAQRGAGTEPHAARHQRAAARCLRRAPPPPGAVSTVRSSGATGSRAACATRPTPPPPAAAQNQHAGLQDRKAGGPGLVLSPPATRSAGDKAQGRTEPTPGARRASWQEPAPADLGQEGRFLFWMRRAQAFGRFSKAFLQILENPKPLVSSAAIQALLRALGGGTAKSPAEPDSTEPDLGLRPSRGLAARSLPPARGRAAAAGRTGGCQAAVCGD